MDNNGWIKIHRKLKEWRWYKEPYTLLLFINLLLSANHKDAFWMDVEVKRGQLVTGRKKLSEETGLSEQQVRSRLKKLEDSGEISVKSTNKYTIITICNFDDYQQQDTSEQPTNNQQITNKQPTNNQQITTNKNDKNDKNDKNVRSKEKEEKESGAETSSAPPLKKKKSSNFIPPEIEEVKKYCEERRNGISAENFIDFYTSKGWMIGKNKMKDWKAAVRTWEKRRSQNGNARSTIHNVPPAGTHYETTFEP